MSVGNAKQKTYFLVSEKLQILQARIPAIAPTHALLHQRLPNHLQSISNSLARLYADG